MKQNYKKSMVAIEVKFKLLKSIWSKSQKRLAKI